MIIRFDRRLNPYFFEDLFVVKDQLEFNAGVREGVHMPVRSDQFGFNPFIKLRFEFGRFRIVIKNFHVLGLGKSLQCCPVGIVNIRHIPCGCIRFQFLIAILHCLIKDDLHIRHLFL
ncbi:hypothetical protein D3C73_1310030 [compost metagenome]